MTQPTNSNPADHRNSWIRELLTSYILPTVATVGRFLLYGPASLQASGMGLRVWLRAMALTAMTLAILNTWLSWSIDRSYGNARLTAINEASSTDEAVQAVITLTGAEPKMAQQDFVREAFRERPKSANCRYYILNIIRSLQGDVTPQVERTIDKYMTGNRHGFRFYVLRTDGVSGTAIVNLLRHVDPTWNHKTALLEDSVSQTRSKDADAFLAKFIDRSAQESRAAIRNLMRFNGWIQWWTVCVCWVILLLVFARAAFLARLVTTGWFPIASPAAGTRFLAACVSPRQAARPNISVGSFAAQSPVESLLDRQVYSTFEFLVTLLPSLGFIGTVIGMGDALLTADSLFSVSDKSLAISVITSHLGFAFDTTLVGLVTGIIAGSTVLQLRIWENALWLSDQKRFGGENHNNGSCSEISHEERLEPSQIARG